MDQNKMKITGPFHTFVVLQKGDKGQSFYMKHVSTSTSPKLSDDVLMHIYSSISELKTYNPSTQQPFKGLNTIGPTVLDSQAIELVLKVLLDFITELANGPNDVKIGEDLFPKKDLIAHIVDVRALFESAKQQGLEILHLGV